MGPALDGQTLREVGLQHLALILNCSAPHSQPQFLFICIKSCIDEVKFHKNSGCFFGCQNRVWSQICLADAFA